MDYKLIRSKRKTVELSIDDDFQPLVKAPLKMSTKDIDAFVEKHKKWIEKHRKLKKERSEKYSVGIKITSAKKRFGSCSGKNSICYSWRLMQYPPEAIDYVVVHELAHIIHKNHGAEFYRLIKKYLPDYKNREKLLK